MICIEGSTFKQAGIQLACVTQPIQSLTVKLQSDFDAPVHYPGVSQQEAEWLSNQTKDLTDPLQQNPCLAGLTKFKLYCRFTLNNWKSFDKLVEILNSKNDNIEIVFVTSVKITQDSFIYKLKNTTGVVENWS